MDPNWPSPPEEMERSLLSFTSFFLRLSRNSLALGSCAFGLDCDVERERPCADLECGLSPGDALLRPGDSSSSSPEDPSLESSSSTDSFCDLAFCQHISCGFGDEYRRCLFGVYLGCLVLVIPRRSATFWWCVFVVAGIVRVDFSVSDINDIQRRFYWFLSSRSIELSFQDPMCVASRVLLQCRYAFCLAIVQGCLDRGLADVGIDSSLRWRVFQLSLL